MGTIPGIAIKRSRCNPAPSVLHTRSGSISGQVRTFSPRFVTLWKNYKAKLFLFLFFSGINYTPTMLCQFKNNSRVFMDDVVEVQCYLPWPHFYGFTASPPRNDMQVTGVVFMWWRSIKEVLSRWTGDQANVESLFLVLLPSINSQSLSRKTTRRTSSHLSTTLSNSHTPLDPAKCASI